MPSLIKLDYDMSYGIATVLCEKRKRILTEIVGLNLMEETWFKSKNLNWHVRLTLKEDLEPLEILAVQLILGSDPVREAFNLRRIRCGQKNWNILFTEGVKELL